MLVRKKQHSQNGALNRKAASFEEAKDKKPAIMLAPAPAAMNSDFVYFDTLELARRLHTDSSCSEHVVSRGSEPMWKVWEKALDFPFNYMAF